MVKASRFISCLIACFFISLPVSNIYAEVDLSLDNGLRLSSADGQHKFHFGGYLLFDAILQDDNTSQPEKFDLFNAWLHLVGTSYKYLHYKVQYSIEESSSTKLRDAYLAYQFHPNIRLQIGQFVVPTVSEYLSSITYDSLPGRSVIGSLTPGRDVGMMLSGSFDSKSWFYSAGLFNGNGIDANGEDNKSKDFVARLTGLLFKSANGSGLRIYPDLSFTSGKQNGDNINFRSEVGTTMLSATGLPVVDRLRLAAGLYIYYGSSFVKVSYLSNKYDLGTGLNGNTSAWSARFSHFLTGEKEQYKSGFFQKLKPNTNYSPGKSGGAWQIVLQFSEWQADTNLVAAANLATTPIVAAKKASSVSVALNWILNPNARISTNLIQTKYDRIGSVIIKDIENKALVRFTLQFF